MSEARRNIPPLTLCELADAGIEGLESFSPFCVKVHRALRLAGLSYTRRHGARPGAFKQYNPTGQVPVLLIGDEPVSDSSEIVRRIEELAPGSMVRGDERAKAEAWLWEELADTSLNGFLVAARWADDRNWPLVKEAYFKGMPTLVRAIVLRPVRSRLIATLNARDVWRAGPERCWARFETTLDQLEARAPRQGYWLGEEATVADIAIFAQLHGLRNELTARQRDQIARRKALSSYLDRVHERSWSGTAQSLAA